MLPLKLTRSVHNLQRLQHIARVLTQHGFGHVVDRLDLGRYVPLWLRRSPHPDAPATVGQRLTKVANELGPTFVKLGQMLASRPDVVPPDILTDLCTLQDHATPFDTAVARDTIAAELRMPVADAFASIEDTPIASGSIGQVYRATLPNGRKVVIKVRRPNIEDTVRTDLQLVAWLAEALERWVPEVRPYRPQLIVEEFERSLLRELDFLHEAATTARIGDALADIDNVTIPEVIWTHSTDAVLTLEALDGVNVNQAIEQDGDTLDRTKLAMVLTDIYLKQFFEVGTFHADPHPGNILIRQPAHIGLIDFGQFGVLSDEMAGNVLLMLLGAVHRDAELIADAMAEMGASSIDTDRHMLMRDIRTLVDKYHGQPVARMNVSTIYAEAAESLRRHDVAMPRDVVMLLKSLVTVWGVALRLDPGMDLAAVLKPRVRAMIRDRLSPGRVLRTGGATLWHLLGFLKTGPHQLRDILRQLATGQWRFSVRHDNLETLGRELDRSSNRLAFAIVIAAIVVGSSMVIRADPQVEVLGVSLQTIGVLGYLVAGILGVGLMWAIVRSGRLS